MLYPFKKNISYTPKLTGLWFFVREGEKSTYLSKTTLTISCWSHPSALFISVSQEIYPGWQDMNNKPDQSLWLYYEGC